MALRFEFVLLALFVLLSFGSVDSEDGKSFTVLETFSLFGFRENARDRRGGKKIQGRET